MLLKLRERWAGTSTGNGENEKWEQKENWKWNVSVQIGFCSNLSFFPFTSARSPSLVTFKFNTGLFLVLFCFFVVVLEPIFVLYLPEQPLPRALRFSHCTEASAKREWLVTKSKGLWEEVSPVFSLPPSVARKFSSRERRLGTRQLPVQDLIQTYNPTVFTMKPQINLQNNDQGIN